jgi:hypothetical protein
LSNVRFIQFPAISSSLVRNFSWSLSVGRAFESVAVVAPE